MTMPFLGFHGDSGLFGWKAQRAHVNWGIWEEADKALAALHVPCPAAPHPRLGVILVWLDNDKHSRPKNRFEKEHFCFPPDFQRHRDVSENWQLRIMGDLGNSVSL